MWADVKAEVVLRNYEGKHEQLQILKQLFNRMRACAVLQASVPFDTQRSDIRDRCRVACVQFVGDNKSVFDSLAAKSRPLALPKQKGIAERALRGLALLSRNGHKVQVRHATRDKNTVADALAFQTAGASVGGGWEVFDWSLLRGVGVGRGAGCLQLRMLSDASVSEEGICTIGVWALVRYCLCEVEGSRGGWEADELLWLGGIGRAGSLAV